MKLNPKYEHGVLMSLFLILVLTCIYTSLLVPRFGTTHCYNYYYSQESHELQSHPNGVLICLLLFLLFFKHIVSQIFFLYYSFDS